MAAAVTDRRPSRNLTAEDLGLELFCGAEPRRAGKSCEELIGGKYTGIGTPHYEFNEEQSDEGPDPHDESVEIEMEREARNGQGSN